MIDQVLAQEAELAEGPGETTLRGRSSTVGLNSVELVAAQPERASAPAVAYGEDARRPLVVGDGIEETDTHYPQVAVPQPRPAAAPQADELEGVRSGEL
jgi:hypothetical protein